MKLDATQMSLTTLVSSSRQGFSIPDFQRNYAWGDAQLDQFWSDITAVAENKFQDHFLGPIVLLDSSGRKAVIDGQQRLTTMVILASVIRDSFVLDYADAQYTVDGTKQVYSHLLNPTIFLSDLTTPLLQGNYQIKNILESYVLKHPKSESRKIFGDRHFKLTQAEKRAAKNLINAQEYLRSKLRSWVDEYSPVVESQLELMNNLVKALNEKIQFLTIVVANEDDAFTIFETLNERGLKLSPADLIKSYILRKIVEEESGIDREAIIDIWDQIMDALEDFDVTNFLRHYLLTIHDGSIQKKVIFKKIKDEIEPPDRAVAPVSPRRKLDEIKYAALNYSTLLGNSGANFESSTVEASIRKLNMIGDSHRIFLLSVLQLGFSGEDLLLAIRSVEKLMFRWVVCGQNAQVLENLLQHASRSLKKNDANSLQIACKYLISNSPSDEIFRLALLGKPSRDTSLQAYALRSICLAITGTEVTTIKKEVSVEHIAPQKPQDSLWYDVIAAKDTTENDPEGTKVYEDYLYQWGNLTILEQRLNSSVRNNIWQIKKEGLGKNKGYNGSSIVTTVELMEIENWTSEVISARTIWFADSALLVWSRELPEGKPALIPGFRYSQKK